MKHTTLTIIFSLSLNLLAACGTDSSINTEIPELDTQSSEAIILTNLPFKAHLDQENQRYYLQITIKTIEPIEGSQSTSALSKSCFGTDSDLQVFDDRVIPAISNANQAGWKAYEKLAAQSNTDDWKMNLELICQPHMPAKATLKSGGHQFQVELDFRNKP